MNKNERKNVRLIVEGKCFCLKQMKENFNWITKWLTEKKKIKWKRKIINEKGKHKKKEWNKEESIVKKITRIDRKRK